MLVHSLWLLSTISLAQAAYFRRQQNASNIIFDGRIQQNATLADFDSADGAFNPDFTKGQNVSFSELIVFPEVEPSFFDQQVGAKAIEVTINDDSIFAPGGSQPQTAVRRAELSPNGAKVADNATTTGIKTLHFSIMPSAERALNLSHEYLMVFLERADFSANVISLKTGTFIGSAGETKNDLVLLGNSANGSETLFTTPFVADSFTNFGIVMDFDQNTVQVFQSTGNDALAQVTEALPNDLSGNGELHFGLNKNPTDPGEDVLRSGFQESGILEGIVYSGIFVEDSADGIITLA